jgi:tol-pal system protein YbgF
MDGVERQLANQALLEMSRQVEILTGELRKLRGEFDQLQHELERSRAQQRDQYVDLDTRLRAAEAALAAAQSGLPPGGPEAEYQAAFNLLKDGKYDEAATALSDFVARNPQHELAPNALYWLGEAHYVRRDYPAALAAFESLLRDYPGTRKAPDALLKAGYSQQELKRLGAARALLTRVVEEYPDTQAAAEAQARLDRFPPGGG